MKDGPRQQFRWAPHVAGAAVVKAKDYQPDGDVEAESDYDAWMRLRGGERALEVGDLLEAADGTLRICKYVGIEAANWMAPEVKAPAAADPPAQAVEV